jgi:hypothetical protein
VHTDKSTLMRRCPSNQSQAIRTKLGQGGFGLVAAEARESKTTVTVH